MSAHETIIAIDFGLRNIGVAVGNTLSLTSRPLTILQARDGVPDWDALSSIFSEWRPDRILVGNPLNMDGSESDMGRQAARFARRIEGRFGLPVTLVDERLSSREAKANALAAGHRGDFASIPVDDEAAAIILATWLHQQ